MNIYHLYQNELNKWKPPQIHQKHPDNNFHASIDHFIEDSDFTSVTIKNHVPKYRYQYFIQYQNIYLYLRLAHPMTNRWQQEIKQILLTATTFQRFFHTNIPIHLIIIPTTYRKKLPSKPGTIIGMHECNSGATLSYHNGDKVIVIWRKEELLKVLLHELIHYHQIDKGIRHINLQEAYTETLANRFYQHLQAAMDNHNAVSNSDRKQEIEFSQYQLAKIIYHLYQRWPDITEDQPIPRNLSDKLSTETNVFGYYWLKAALLSNLDAMEHYWARYGYQMNRRNAKRFQELARESLTNPMFQNRIKYWVKNVDQPPNRQWRNTLRMTAF